MTLEQLIENAKTRQLNHDEEILELKTLAQTNKVNEKYIDTKGYLALLAITYLASESEQTNLTPQQRTNLARNHAFKLIVLFGSAKDAIIYLERYQKQIKSDEKQFIHDACLFTLPINEQTDYLLWQQIILHNKPSAPTDKILRLVPFADAIQNYVTKNYQTLVNDISTEIKSKNTTATNKTIAALIESKTKVLLSKTTPIDQLAYYASQVCYAQRQTNPKAAEVFFQFYMPEELFNVYLKLVPQDDPVLIPDTRIEGNLFGDSNYVLYKLSPSDPRAALLGKMTGCCQVVGDVDGGSVVIHGIQDPSSGFYVLCDTKTDTILAQTFAWNNDKGIIVFDSIESQIDFRTKNSALIVKAFKTLAQNLVESHDIFAVHVGLGGNTPPEIAGPKPVVSLYDIKPVNYSGYSDAYFQIIIAHSLFPLYTLEQLSEITTPVLKSTKQWTKPLLIEFCIHLTAMGEPWNDDYISQEELAENGLVRDDCENAMKLAKRFFDGFFPKPQENYTTSVFELISLGINPLIEVYGFTLFHHLILVGTEEQLTEAIALVGKENACQMVRRHWGYQQLTALGLGAKCVTPSKMKILIELFPTQDLLEALMDVDYDSVTVLRYIQLHSPAKTFDIAMGLLSKKDQEKFYTGFTNKIDHDPLTYSCYNLEMLWVSVKYCPDEYLEARLSCTMPKKSSLIRSDIPDECFEYILKLTPKTKLLHASFHRTECVGNFWNYLSKYNNNVQALLITLDPDERYAALSASSDIYSGRKVPVLYAMNLNENELQTILNLLPRKYWVQLITNNNSTTDNLFTFCKSDEKRLALKKSYYDAVNRETSITSNSIFKNDNSSIKVNEAIEDVSESISVLNK